MARNTTTGLIQSLLFLFMTSLAFAQSPQCPNNLAVYNPNLRTACVNGSMLPIGLSLPCLYTTALTDTLPQRSSLSLSTLPQFRAPSRPTILYLFPRPTSPSFPMASQQECILCLFKSISRTTSACRRCRSQHRCWMAISLCRMWIVWEMGRRALHLV